MKQMLLVILSLFILSLGYGQTVIFSEDFESGTPSDQWEPFWDGEEPLSTVAMSSAPAVLLDGGNYVGLLHDADGTYTGYAMAVAGDVTLQNYAIEADVYCYVNNTAGTVYSGLVVYADSSHAGSESAEFYYKLVADFDGSNRFRLYNNQLSMTIFNYTFSHDIDATGYYTTDAWHKMRLEATTIDSNTTRFVCYFDGFPIGTPYYEDTGVDVYGQGKFGLYGSAIANYYDNIVVYDLDAVGVEDENSLPNSFELKQNYPNPFNPTTTISYNLLSEGFTTLKIFDINGKYINTLVAQNQIPQNYTVLWNGTDISGMKVPSGVYIYRLTQGSVSSHNKMMLLK
ncbi:MAG: T9SS type A sorting domain-containing protein [Candidatus Marinimicrobia bacterium]|nr:T9SS type A sorting domain-containing protein [Candidatus Neomarinimicrobiota bacterium]